MKQDNQASILEGLKPSTFYGLEKNDVQSLSFPTRKDEDWKYTSVSKIIKKQYVQGSQKPQTHTGFEGEYAIKMSDGVWVNQGELAPIKGLTISLVDEKHKLFNTIVGGEREIFTAINTAYCPQALFINVEKNTKIDPVLHIVLQMSENDVMAQPRLLVNVEKGSDVQIVVSYLNDGVTGCFTNSVMEVFVAENARCEITKIQGQGENRAICTEQVRQEQNSTFLLHTITKNQLFVRNGVNVEVVGENCETYLNGIYLPKKKELIDNHTRIDHLVSNCMSSEIYKGVLRDKSQVVFNGKVKVFEDAQKINAYQKNKNVLLSREATMNAKPELEIYADDVKCSHGTTTGELDTEALFYLQSRGISKDTAKDMLIVAFIKEVLQEIGRENVLDYTDAFLRETFKK